MRSAAEVLAPRRPGALAARPFMPEMVGQCDPVAFVAFDLLWLYGHSLSERPWHERRARLDELALEGPSWTTPSAYEGDPAPLLEAAAASGVETLVAKRVDAPYDPSLDPSPWLVFAVPSAG